MLKGKWGGVQRRRSKQTPRSKDSLHTKPNSPQSALGKVLGACLPVRRLRSREMKYRMHGHTAVWDRTKPKHPKVCAFSFNKEGRPGFHGYSRVPQEMDC